VTVYNQAPALRGRTDYLWDNFPELDTNFNGVDITATKRLSRTKLKNPQGNQASSGIKS